jgi:GNAT superfamily N-acetyltransferase
VTNDLELIELVGRGREFLTLEVAENQRKNVATMAESFADALFSPPDDGWETSETWIRGVTRGGAPAGFIMCADSPDGEQDPWIWRLLVDREHQGQGVGTFAMESAINRYRASNEHWRPFQSQISFRPHRRNTFFSHALVRAHPTSTL